MTELVPGHGARTITRELGSGRSELRFDWDLGGTNRDEVTGTEIRFEADAVFEIVEDDPLSARVAVHERHRAAARGRRLGRALRGPHGDDLRRGELPRRSGAAGVRRRRGGVRAHVVARDSARRRLAGPRRASLKQVSRPRPARAARTRHAGACPRPAGAGGGRRAGGSRATRRPRDSRSGHCRHPATGADRRRP